MISSTKTDPRVLRTRRLIQEAFLSLAQERDFESVTVKEIAEKATVNRATFYAHFEDKYILLESLVHEKFMDIFTKRLPIDAEFNQDTIYDLIVSACDYQETFTICKTKNNSVDSIVGNKVQLQLQELVIHMMVNTPDYSNIAPSKLEIAGTMVSASIYNAVRSWYSPEQSCGNDFAHEILPFLMNGTKELLKQNRI